ncbi:MAG: NUDIX domain-containing protein [Candidatus Paceibacterota bacterium]|jgi:ADP-ribose pyrophosphatase YjhB (NUDIX family)
MTNFNSPGEELIDVINESDIVIESKPKDEIHHAGLLHREVHVWLFDENKNIYFAKTSANKFSAGLLDAPIGGHVSKGENYLEAAIRETKEESGLVVSPSDLILLSKFTGTSQNEKRINNFMRSVYVYTHPVKDNLLNVDKEENDGFEKFSIDFLLNVKNEEMAKFHKFILTDEVPLVIKHLMSVNVDFKP